MAILELLNAGRERPRPVRLAMRLMSDLMSSFRSDDGIWCNLDFNTLERLYLAAKEALDRPPSPMVVFDNCTIFIRGKEVEGLTSFQKTVVIYLHNAGRATVDTLLDDVWKTPDGKRKAVLNIFTVINQKLEQHRCAIERQGGDLYQLIFF